MWHTSTTATKRYQNHIHLANEKSFGRQFFIITDDICPGCPTCPGQTAVKWLLFVQMKFKFLHTNYYSLLLVSSFDPLIENKHFCFQRVQLFISSPGSGGTKSTHNNTSTLLAAT